MITVPFNKNLPKIVFSDLDGTLLDHDTYSFQESSPGIDLLKKYQIPLILTSSKTLQEMKKIKSLLKINYPFIFENGGGIFISEGKTELLGVPVSKLQEKKDLLVRLLQKPIKTIIEMDLPELEKKTGLKKEKVVLAKKRKVSLPFIILAKEPKVNLTEVNKKLKKENLHLTKGGRFFHLSSLQATKGEAVKKIIKLYETEKSKKFYSLAFGDSENDISMFQQVDLAFLVKKNEKITSVYDLKNLIITKEKGPKGFTEGINKILANENL